MNCETWVASLLLKSMMTAFSAAWAAAPDAAIYAKFSKSTIENEITASRHTY